MTPLELALCAVICCAVSGIPALAGRLSPVAGRRVAYCLTAVGAVAGLTASAGMLLGGGGTESAEIIWRLPVGTMLFRFDHLSAFFFIPALLVGLAVSIFSCGYFATTSDNRGESVLTTCFGLLLAAILLVILAANGVTLLIFWEAMALLVFVCMSLEHTKPEVRQAGLQYLIASHLATLLIAIVVILLPGGGVLRFPQAGSLVAQGTLPAVIILTALAGFGLKAGVMPLHVWLPAAHANAPGQVSAIMSGVLIKVGIYGIIRVISFYGHPPLWWGVMLVTLGIISAVCGVLFAIGQHDLKRLLAYHSIENIGIIVMGIGIAQIGLSQDNRILFVLGMAGALLHVLNHALFKSLLFMGAGMVVHVTGTRNMDRMGGVANALPLTSLGFLIGAVAICGLPPLNGFVSELLIYLGIFRGFGEAQGGAAAILALAAPALAMTGGLALACFVKVYGCVFLGNPRVALPEPHESSAAIGGMALAALLCIGIGIMPFAIVTLLEPVLAQLAPAVLLPSIQTTAHLYGIGIMAAILIFLTSVLAVWYINRLKNSPVGSTGTWDCGYAAPEVRMQYTASSFAQMLVDIFRTILLPDKREPDISGLFPGKSRFESHVPEVVLDKVIMPFFALVDSRFARLRKLQGGHLNHYILYVVIAVLALLVLADVI